MTELKREPASRHPPASLNKIQSAIVAILYLLGSRVHRTKLVKLVYLLDNLFYESIGRTLTSLEYMWDDYGPNAVSNAIVREADHLANEGILLLRQHTTMYGSIGYTYEVPQAWSDISGLLLDPTEWEFVRKAVQRYGHMSIASIVKASKETQPFKKARRYHLLEMHYDEKVRAAVEAVRSNDEFMEGIREGLEAAKRGEGKTLEQIQREYCID